MPIKKRKSGKKKKKKSSSRGTGDCAAEDEGQEDPATAMSGDRSMPNSAGKKTTKKGKRLKKMTKSEKALDKLDKAANKIRESTLAYHRFVDRMDKWLTVYYPRAVELFRRFDEDGDGTLSYEEFKSGMLDLNAPCTTIELHLLARMLDQDDTGDIDYTKFSKGLSFIRELEQMKRDADEMGTQLILSERSLEHCACCKLGLWHPYVEKNPKYLMIEMRLVTFDNFEDHPAHFTILIHSHIPVYGLIRLVEEETDIQSTTISIFSNPSRSKDVLLPGEDSFEELGYVGGSKDDPGEITLYYDYTVEFTDCPLLMCDHYFGHKSY